MLPFEIVLLLLAFCVGLGMLARYCRMPYPILLVVGGLILSVQPWAPRFELNPDIVLLLFLPPLLYAGAFNTSWKAFRSNIRAISLLAVGLVLFTTTVVAIVAHEFVGLPWAVAFILGAIVSPPDAVAAMAITQNVKLPKIVTTILEGESLVNDATALVAYRMAVASVIGGAFSLSDAIGKFAIVSVGGIAVGLAGGWLILRMHRWIDKRNLADAKLTIAITLLTPFAVFFPAEHLHVSGVLAVVTAGLWVGHRSETIFRVDWHHEARAVWEMVEFLLNSLIFILIGFQLPYVLEHLGDQYTLVQLASYATVVSLVVVVARLVWVFPGAYVPRWLDRVLFGCRDPYPPWQSVAVVGWTGMRGVVSLAAAMALPLEISKGVPFPGRDIVQFLTFWVIFATLVGQGLTLPALVRWLGVDRQPGAQEAEKPEENESC